MAKGFTPIIGLAVVVALAMAAVFGAMSLTNPAFAAVGAPADAELAERTFSPQVSSLSALGGDGRVTLTWNTTYVAATSDDPRMGAAHTNWEVRWRLGDEAYSVDDWHKSMGLTLEENGTAVNPNVSANERGVLRDISFAAEQMPGVDGPDNPRYTMTAVVGISVAADDLPAGTNELEHFSEGAGNLRNFAEYEFQVRDGTDPDDQTRVWTISRTPASTPDEVDDLDAEPGIREVVLEWDKAPSDNYVSAWQVLYYSEEDAELSGVTDAAIRAETGDVVIAGVDYVAPVTGDDSAEPQVVAVTEVDFVPEISWMTISNSDEDTDGYTIDELDSGTMYTFWVRAVSFDTTGLVDEDDESYEVVDAEDMKPAAPMDLTATNTTSEGAEDDEGSVNLSWDDPDDPGVTSWEYSYMDDSDGDPVWMTIEEADAMMQMISGLMLGEDRTFMVRAIAGPATGEASEANVTPLAPQPFMPTFEAQSPNPGKNTRYDLMVGTMNGDMNTLTDEMVIELEDFMVPSGIGVNSIAINVDEEPGVDQDRTTIPEDVSVSGEKLFITIGDLNKDRTGGNTSTAQGETADFTISSGSIIHVVIRQSAGIKNPSEAKTYGPVVEIESASTGAMLIDLDFNAEDADENKLYPGLRLAVPRILDLDEEDGGLGTVVVATGKGFRNDTSLTLFVDIPSHQDDDDNPATDAADDDGVAGEDTPVRGTLDLGEDVLCEVDKIGKDDIGTCEFTVSHPTFSGGDNYVNAVDGRNGYVSDVTDLAKFELTASIAASPASGSPGEIILIQVVDFPRSSSITRVQLGRLNYCGANSPDGSYRDCPGQVDSTGSGNFKITVPNWARAGIQELKVFGESDTDAATNVDIGGPRVQITPETVLANQRVSLVGVGFSAGENIAQVSPGTPQVSKMSIGGETIGWSRINGGQAVSVDSGGNWSASVDLPLEEATTGAGERVIRITDSGGRSGTITVTVAERTVTITPEIGRVGTQATVRGKNFPSKNDDGSSFNVEIIYDAGNDRQTTVSAVPDASGNFEVSLRIPSTASIPSTNTVKVQFEDDKDITVVTTVAHDVPEGSVTLSQTSGSPGSTVTVSGFGFKNFVPIRNVKVGSIEVTPLPVDGATGTGQERATDSQGMLEFNILIPGLDVGIQTVEVNVGQTTASTGFTVTASGVSAGDITASAKAVENMGTNFVRAFNFNNDTKTWTFYDPAAGDASTLENFITGESYWILIMTSDASVILNNKTRNLTCVDGNCWNLIVW